MTPAHAPGNDDEIPTPAPAAPGASAIPEPTGAGDRAQPDTGPPTAPGEQEPPVAATHASPVEPEAPPAAAVEASTTDDGAAPPPAGPRTSGRRPIRLRWIVVPLGLLVLAWLAVCAITVADAVGRLHRGVDTLTAARSHLHLSSLQDAPVTASLDRATGDFQSAHDLLSDPWMAPLDIAPYVGRQLHSARSLSSAAGTVTTAGRTALVQTQALLRQPHDQPAERAALLVKLQGVVDPLETRLDNVDLGPSNALLPTLASRRATFAADLTRLQTDVGEGSAALRAVTDLINNSRTYLVFAANNAEMRAGSGDYLAVGTVTSQQGSLSFSPFTATGQLADPPNPVPVTGDMAAVWGGEHPSQDFRDLGFTPQFPANAALAAQMWQAEQGQKVDGVLVIDVDALRSLLQATGPLTVQGQPVDAGSVDQLLLEQQYVGVTDDSDSQARQGQQAVLAAGILSTLQTSPPPLTALAQAVANAADGRHLMAWAADPSVERAWLASGAGGRVSSDGLLLSLINNNANKLDPYQQVRAQLSTARAGADTRVRIEVTVANQAPPDLSQYAAQGANASLPAGTYAGAVTLDYPRYARSATLVPAASTGDGPDYGSRVLGAPIQLSPGRTARFAWTLVMPGHHGQLVIDPSGRVPATAWTGPQDQHFDDGRPVTVRW
jgi:hypothetical protein